MGGYLYSWTEVIVFRRDSFQIAPVLTHANFNQQGHRERVHVFHVFANQGSHDLQLVLRNFKNQLVVDLKGHSRLKSPFTNSRINSDHGDLDEVGGSAL